MDASSRPTILNLALAPSYSPTRRQLVKGAKDKPRFAIDFGSLQGHFATILSSIGLDVVPILSEPPSNARDLINNSTWCLNAAYREQAMAHALLDAAENGQMMHFSELVRLFDIPRERSSFVNRMEDKTLTHLFKLGFFIERVPHLRGYFAIFFLDTDVRRVELLREMDLLHASKGEQDLPYFDKVLPFDPELFMFRVRKAFANDLLNARERALFGSVAHHQAAGAPPASSVVVEDTGIPRPTLHRWVHQSEEKRHARGFYVRATQSPTLEGVLLHK